MLILLTNLHKTAVRAGGGGDMLAFNGSVQHHYLKDRPDGRVTGIPRNLARRPTKGARHGDSEPLDEGGGVLWRRLDPAYV